MSALLSREYQKNYEDHFHKILLDYPDRYWDESALPAYTHSNRLIAWLFWQRLGKAFQLSPDIAGKRVLDFGCGAGVSFKYLADQKCRITGCDNKADDLARQTCAVFGLSAEITKDLFSLTGNFDYIFALDVLERGCVNPS